MAKIVVLATGGTIAGKAAHAHETVVYQSAQIQVNDLIQQVSGLDAVLQNDTLIAEQVAQVDSKDMDFAVWQKLLQRCAFWLAQTDVRGVVVTHGTDTIEETAFFLQQALAYCPKAHTWQGKALVLTCAMRPANARMPDGAQNFAEACCVVRNCQAQGVLVVCAGTIHSATAVQKIHPYRLDAFSSGDAGNMGWIESHHVRWLTAVPAWQCCGLTAEQKQQCWHTMLHTEPQQFPWVEILHSHAGADARALTAWVRAGVNGVVLAGTGNATYHQALAPAIQTAQLAGVVLVLTSRCYAGAVVRNTDAVCDDIPLAYSDNDVKHRSVLSPAKARVQLLLRLLLQKVAA